MLVSAQLPYAAAQGHTKKLRTSNHESQHWQEAMNSTCISLCKPKVVEKGVEYTNLNAKGANISTPQGNKKCPAS